MIKPVPASAAADADAPVAEFPSPVLTALDAAAAACAALLILLANIEVGGVVRLLLALAFVSFVPGWALLAHVPLARGWSRVALAVAVSLALCTAAASAMAWLEQWRPTVLLDMLGGLSLVAIVAGHAGRR